MNEDDFLKVLCVLERERGDGLVAVHSVEQRLAEHRAERAKHQNKSRRSRVGLGCLLLVWLAALLTLLLAYNQRWRRPAEAARTQRHPIDAAPAHDLPTDILQDLQLVDAETPATVNADTSALALHDQHFAPRLLQSCAAPCILPSECVVPPAAASPEPQASEADDHPRPSPAAADDSSQDLALAASPAAEATGDADAGDAAAADAMLSAPDEAPAVPPPEGDMTLVLYIVLGGPLISLLLALCYCCYHTGGKVHPFSGAG